ncbi:MAG: acyl carrier protein [Burkholderiaceae bacterium]|jgi:acyl carrier protein|nr:acyl carrier protein [Burkholderiaceae bacterium]
MDIADTVKKIMAETFRVDPSDIQDSVTMDEIDTWDSLTHMELVANLESTLGIVFDGDEIADMSSVLAIQKLVVEKHGAR